MPASRFALPSSPRSRSRSRLLVLLGTVGAACLALGSASTVAAVVALNADARATAELSATEGDIGDPVTLELAALDADDLYSATVQIGYRPSVVALDFDSIASDFDGMWSAVGRADGDRATVDLTVTRLGTSDGIAGEVTLGTLDFVGLAPGDPNVTVEKLTVVDSVLDVTSTEPGTPLSYAVLAPPPPPEPEPEPSVPVVEEPVVYDPVFVATGQGGRTAPRTSTGSTPGLSATPSADAPISITLGNARVALGGSVDLTVKNAPANTELQVTFVSDGSSLGSTRSDASGSATARLVIPRTAPVGEQELALSAGGNVIGSAQIEITSAATSTPTPTASPSSGAAADAGSDGPGDASISADQASQAGLPWLIGGLIVGGLGLVAVILAMMAAGRRTKGAGV